VTCESVHRRLLALESPEAPPADVRLHLEHCPACRSFQEHLVQMEAEVPRLPVPEPARKAAFLRTLREDASLLAPPPPRLHMPVPGFRRERGLRKMAVAVALAASLLVIALGALLWQSGSPDIPGHNPDSLARRSPLEQRLEGMPTWSQAKGPRDRVAVLDGLADEVERTVVRTRRAVSREEMERQVKFYQEVIDRLTEIEAKGLSDTERKEVLDPIARRLAAVDSEATRLARRHPEMADSLRQLASVAAEGDRKLRALLA
jgi:hypothetical protein